MKFSQQGGAFGTFGRPVNGNFRPVANPWASVAAGYPAPNFQPRPVPVQSGIIPPRTASATIAGRVGIGCCGGCTEDFRKASS